MTLLGSGPVSVTALPGPEQLSSHFLQPLENWGCQTSKNVQERKDIPIVLAVEMFSQLAAPIIGDILSVHKPVDELSVCGVQFRDRELCPRRRTEAPGPCSTKKSPIQQRCPRRAIPSQVRTSMRVNKTPMIRPSALSDFDSKLFAYVHCWSSPLDS